MSNPMTGADLDQLDALATTYSSAGTEIAGRAADVRARIQQAVSTFGATMARLQQQSSTLTQAMNDEIAAVSSQAAAVAWTGSNRGAFDADLQRFDAQVRTGSAAIDTGVSELRAAVDTRFTPVLEEFGVSVTAAGDGVGDTTQDLRTAVSQQRSALEQTANIGWTSA